MRQFRLFLFAALIPLGSMVSAASPDLKPTHPDRYVVQRGDTLWDISGRFLRDPWHWPDIWHVNPAIENPHLIYPGDTLELSFIDGRPRLALARRSSGPRDVKLEPGARREPLTRAIPAIPIDAIHQFLTRPRVLSREELEAAPEVIAFVHEHIVGGAGDPVYASSIEYDDILKFDVVRPEMEYRDPDTGEALGREALFVGDAELLRPGTPAKLMLTTSAMESQIGDRVLPDPAEEVLENFQPKPAPPFLEGKIIAVLNGVDQIGQYSVVALNRGEREGLEPGDVFRIMQRSRPPRMLTLQGRRVPAPVLPLEEAGVLMVFRIFERVSYGLVMAANQAIHLHDTVVSPDN